jgi:hypothetical protein
MGLAFAIGPVWRMTSPKGPYSLQFAMQVSVLLVGVGVKGQMFRA